MGSAFAPSVRDCTLEEYTLVAHVGRYSHTRMHLAGDMYCALTFSKALSKHIVGCLSGSLCMAGHMLSHHSAPSFDGNIHTSCPRHFVERDSPSPHGAEMTSCKGE